MRKIKHIDDYANYTGIDEHFKSKVDCCTDKSAPTVAQQVQCLMNGGSIGRVVAPPSSLCYDFDERSPRSLDDVIIETNDVSLQVRKNVDLVDFQEAQDKLLSKPKQALKSKPRVSNEVKKEVINNDRETENNNN